MLATTRPYFVVSGGIWDGLTITLTSRPMVIGRHANSDIIIADATVSRHHALIIETGRGVALRDLRSVNGTYVNDRNIGSDKHLLKNGDRIRLAGSAITLVVRQEAARAGALNADSSGHQSEEAAMRPPAESLTSR